MNNHWIEVNTERAKFKVGDYVYWKRQLFTDLEWTTVILQFGTDPMVVIKIYHDTKRNGTRLETADSNGHLITGVRPDRLDKVDKDFEASL